MAVFNELNDYILIHIFKLLDLNELVKITFVCKKWYRIINKNKDIWKKFIPRSKLDILHKVETLKELLMKYSTKIGKEFWFPHPYKAFQKRNQYMTYLLYIHSILCKSNLHKKCGFKLYQRLNLIYELIEGDEELENEVLLPEEEKDEKEYECYYTGFEFEDKQKENYTSELLNVVDFIWKKFNNEENSVFTLTSAKKVWKYSKLVTCKEFVKVSFFVLYSL